MEVFSTECVLILIEHGASPDIPDKNSSTPLHLATVNKKPSVIAIICNSNGNINVRDEVGVPIVLPLSCYLFLVVINYNIANI